MGWNSKSQFETGKYNLNWRDYVGDSRIDEFEQKLAGDVAEFIASKIKAEFGADIANDQLSFTAWGGGKDFDSYTKE